MLGSYDTHIMYGRRDLAQYNGVYVSAFLFGMSAGVFTANRTYDISGNYRPYYYACVLLLIVLFFLLQFILRPIYRK